MLPRDFLADAAGKTRKHENRKSHLFSYYTALPEFNQSLREFSRLVELQLACMLLYGL